MTVNYRRQKASISSSVTSITMHTIFTHTHAHTHAHTHSKWAADLKENIFSTKNILVENLVRIYSLTWSRFPKYGTRISKHKRNKLIN